ncbi:hypothetical protein [Mycobacterium attenuatum]|uniref:hypothetical protein n=1 Tax=Mycobacterium attenuatum TaxID=2341086 RepID=UPI000F022DF2|nr:hypothetical protein [Mycobacterium attenuatum]VBA62308.1 hypothetical protein LAUMK41_05699 [Mycobacterium attenuatum]
MNLDTAPGIGKTEKTAKVLAALKGGQQPGGEHVWQQTPDPGPDPAPPLRALRTFRVDPFAGPHSTGALLPIVGNDPTIWWAGCYAVAQCGHRRDHYAPHRDCSCGISGTTDINALIAQHPLLAGNIVVVIDCHPTQSYWAGDSVRSLSGRIVAYWCHPSPRLHMAREVLAHTGAEEFADPAQLIRAYLPGAPADHAAADPLRPRPPWRDVLSAVATYGGISPTLRYQFRILGDVVRYVLLPTILAAAIAKLAHLAARPAPRHTDTFSVAAQQFVTTGRYLLGALIQTSLPHALLAMLIMAGAIRGLLTSPGYPAPSTHAALLSLGATMIQRSGQLIMPLSFVVYVLAHRAHLPAAGTFEAIALTTYVAYFGAAVAPAVSRLVATALRRRRQDPQS